MLQVELGTSPPPWGVLLQYYQPNILPNRVAFHGEPESCCSKWLDRLASLVQLPGGCHAFHDIFQLICQLQSQAGPRPEFYTVLCFHLAILGFSRNVILLHSTAGTATDETIFFVFSIAELVVA